MEASKIASVFLGVMAAILSIVAVASFFIGRHTEYRTVTIPPAKNPGSSHHKVARKVPALTLLQQPELNKRFSWAGDFKFVKSRPSIPAFETPIVPYVCGLVTPDPEKDGDGGVINNNTGKPIPADDNKCFGFYQPGIEQHLACDTCQTSAGMIFYDWRNSKGDYFFDTVPESTGWTGVPPEGDQVVCSTENGYNIFGQLILDGASDHIEFKVKRSIEGNRVFSGKTKVNPGVSALGAAGHRSIVYSTDGLRLYMAYRANGGADDQQFAFKNTAGHVAVYSRPLTRVGEVPTESYSTSTSYGYQPGLTVDHPFGSQVTTLTGQQTPPIGTIGSVMRTSVNPVNGNRVLAVRLESDFYGDSSIAVYEERGNDMVIASLVTGPSTSAVRAFAKDFALGQRRMVVNNTLVNHTRTVTWYEMDEKTFKWSSKGTLPVPDGDHGWFGHSVEMSSDDKHVIVSSPQIGGKGGKVYLYEYDGTAYKLSDTLEDRVGYAGTYGTFTSVDKDFTILSVSANSNTKKKSYKFVTVPVSDDGANDKAGHVYLYSIDRDAGKFHKDNKATDINIRQHVNPTAIVDCKFGAGVSISRNRNQESYTIAVPELLNKSISVYRAVTI